MSTSLRAECGFIARFLAASLAGWAVAASAVRTDDSDPTRMSDADRQTNAELLRHIEARDCPALASALNAAIAKKRPQLLMTAGAILEEGGCVKADWQTATVLYERAHKAGHQFARARLVAALATENRDVAAALWWAQQGARIAMPRDCAVSDHVANDSDRFVAELRTWTQPRLRGCAYAVGVVSAIQGDVYFPDVARKYGVTGVVRMQFKPATGSIELQWVRRRQEGPGGVVSDATMQLSRSDEVRNAPLESLKALAERAQRRFVRPEGIDPTWVSQVTYVFTLD